MVGLGTPVVSYAPLPILQRVEDCGCSVIGKVFCMVLGKVFQKTSEGEYGGFYIRGL